MSTRQHKIILSNEQMDFLREMLNIGAGNAAVAFSQMLQCMVEVKIPEIYFFPASQIPPFLKDPDRTFVGVSMNMVGDVNGKLFYLVQDEQKERLVEIAQGAAPGSNESGVATDLSVLEEIGNILAGVFLVAIHDFCRLNIYHTVPELRIDMIQALIDEAIASTSAGTTQIIILIENEFVIREENISTFFLIIPDRESIHKFVNSIDNARKRTYGN